MNKYNWKIKNRLDPLKTSTRNGYGVGFPSPENLTFDISGFLTPTYYDRYIIKSLLTPQTWKSDIDGMTATTEHILDFWSQAVPAFVAVELREGHQVGSTRNSRFPAGSLLRIS